MAIIRLFSRATASHLGPPLSLDEGIKLVEAAVARLNAEMCLKGRWAPGSYDPMGSELADEQTKPCSAK